MRWNPVLGRIGEHVGSNHASPVRITLTHTRNKKNRERVALPEWEVGGVEQHDAAQVVRRFHDLYCQSRVRTWMNTYWLGIPVLKTPLDLWVYQELLFKLRPDVIVETGTAQGGSALFMATIFDILDRGRIITVDIGIAPNRPTHPRIEYLTGSSTHPEMVDRVERLVREGEHEKVMVMLDSKHDRDHVLEEMRLYWRLVTPGSYMIVEDTNINSWRPEDRRRPGPLEAVREFFAENDCFEIDRSCEKFFVTWNPSGYLRRLETSSVPSASPRPVVTPETVRARDLMDAEPSAIKVSDNLLEAAAALLEDDNAALPIVDEEGILEGLLTMRAVVEVLVSGRDPARTPVGEAAAPAVSISESATPEEAREMIRQNGLRALPVVENGRLVGSLGRRKVLDFIENTSILR